MKDIEEIEDIRDIGLVGSASLHRRALANSFKAFDVYDASPSCCSLFLFRSRIEAQFISSARRSSTFSR